MITPKESMKEFSKEKFLIYYLSAPTQGGKDHDLLVFHFLSLILKTLTEEVYHFMESRNGDMGVDTDLNTIIFAGLIVTL